MAKEQPILPVEAMHEYERLKHEVEIQGFIVFLTTVAMPIMYLIWPHGYVGDVNVGTEWVLNVQIIALNWCFVVFLMRNIGRLYTMWGHAYPTHHIRGYTRTIYLTGAVGISWLLFTIYYLSPLLPPEVSHYASKLIHSIASH